MPVNRAFPNGIKLSGQRRSLRGAMANGVPSDYDRCSLLREVGAFSISSGLFIVLNCSEGSDGGMLFQGIEVSNRISINLSPLDCFCLVWCFMERCICC